MVKCVTCGWSYPDGKGCPRLSSAYKRAMTEWREYSTRRSDRLDEDGHFMMIIERNPPPIPEWSIIDWFLEDRYCPDYHPYFERPDFK